jgi:hypothetical protein
MRSVSRQSSCRRSIMLSTQPRKRSDIRGESRFVGTHFLLRKLQVIRVSWYKTGNFKPLLLLKIPNTFK